MHVFGGSGGLGTQLVPKLKRRGYAVKSFSSKDVDITDFAEVRDIIDTDKPDIVLNLAGSNVNGFLHKVGDNWELRKAAYNVIKINTIGSLNLVMASLSHMRRNNYGRIILISSVLTKSPVVGTGVYASSKAFIEGLVKSCALENAAKNVTCNALKLGYFDGGLTYDIPEKERADILRSVPSQRWGTIEELLSAVSCIIETPYITGTSLEVDGGIQ
jgi:3-oxoacyl-[acyl-carrier protein] reductase|tara:strand:+ start:33032 stop:33679 length:648 start_codon:yes stop_codon:yes gene_type:complete